MVVERFGKPWGKSLSGSDSQSLRHLMVALAQLVERKIVALDVQGPNP